MDVGNRGGGTATRESGLVRDLGWEVRGFEDRESRESRVCALRVVAVASFVLKLTKSQPKVDGEH